MVCNSNDIRLTAEKTSGAVSRSTVATTNSQNSQVERAGVRLLGDKQVSTGCFKTVTIIKDNDV